MRMRRPKLDAHAQTKMRCARTYQNEMRMRSFKKGAHAQAKMRCTWAGKNEMRMSKCKWDAHLQVKMRCPCAGKNAMRMRRSKWGAQAQTKMKCAWAGVNEMRMRRSKWGVYAQAKMRCTWAGQNEMFSQTEINIDYRTVVLGWRTADPPLLGNFILLTAKSFIFRSKINSNPPSLIHFKKVLISCYLRELYSCIKYNKKISLMDKWSPLNIWLSQNISGTWKSLFIILQPVVSFVFVFVFFQNWLVICLSVTCNTL